MVRHFLLSLILVLTTSMLFAQTSIQGKVKDVETGEDLIGANVVLNKEGVYAAGTSTDFDGNFSMNVDPGTYDVEVSYIGFPTNRIEGVVVKAGQANRLDVELGGGDGGITLDEVIVKEYKVPLIEQDNTTSGGVITSEQIRNLPTKDISALAASTAGLSQSDEGGDITVRGSRSDGTNYYIDGIRVSGSSALIPQSEIDQLQVITGGIEAQYGDVTGGIISITTKGPSAKYTGGLEVETSEGLDAFGYNLLSGNFSGPILKKKSGESIIGFRVSGQYRQRKDDRPPGLDIFRVKDDVLAELEANPLTRVGSSLVPSAEFLTNEDVDVLDAQPFEESTRLDITAKLDARLSKAIDLTLTGAFSDEEDQFTPRGDQRTGTNWRVFNSHNNPTSYETRYRGNLRFRHRLGGATAVNDDTEGTNNNNKGSIIRNAEYTLQFGYEKRFYDEFDQRHEDRLFDYGHIGNFDISAVPFIDGGSLYTGPGSNDFTIGHLDWTETFNSYTPGTTNPGLVNYNNNADPENLNSFPMLNGQYVGNIIDAWGFHTNVNLVHNLFRKRDEDRFTLNVNSTFDLMPGGSDKGRHAIQFGIMYEQRINRGYDINPRQLWRVARGQQNRHILGVDTTNIIGMIATPQLSGAPFFIDEVPEFGTFTTTPSELDFYREVRDVAGVPLDQQIYIDGLSPDQLSLDLFSARELNDQFNLINLDYYGFDYLGNKLANDVTFDDFFTATDESGNRTFPVAAIQPIYAAAFIQDKFTFKDIIFRLGVRVDRFDANTKVLKDPYSLYEIMNANDFYAQTGGDRPAGVEDDWSVYVEGPGSNAVKAFRTGDDWYFGDGEPANGGQQIFGGGVVTPQLYEDRVNDIKSRDFDPNNSFKDYEAQINWMPRLAFSFPISDAANFFAHYDILVQRPSALGVNINRATALDYFYFNESQAFAANPDLKPQTTVDYEVGFQQKLTNSSAIKIAAYYKELRNMIARRTYLFLAAPISSYETFGNQDFGTTKGFTFQYDLRRTGNLQFSTNYTLQFADGTGSDADGRRGLSSRGNIRTLFPLNFDERHRLVTTIDYRYGSGKKYDGPTVGGADIFANAGLNIQAIAVSGRPYTAKSQAQKLDGAGTVGQINGARLPWNFSINARLDKDFILTKPSAKRQLALNVYFRVQNVMNAQNIINVYEATGSPFDDGYIASPFGQAEVANINRSGRNLDAFIDAYTWRVLNPNFISLPRRMFIGAVFDF